MLVNRLKYDLKSIFKGLVVFYSLSLFFGILTRIFFALDNSTVLIIIGKVLSGTTISMLFNILINTIIRLWVVFKNNFYGDESYLTHTLPISKNRLYLSKLLTAIISSFVSVAIMLLTMFIAYYTEENFELLKTIMFPIADLLGVNWSLIVATVVIILFLEIVNAIQCGYTGIIIGHMNNSAKVGLSVVFGLVTYIISQCIVLMVMFAVALTDSSFMQIFISNEITNFEIFTSIAYIATAVYLALVFMIAFVNFKLFNKGVNVD